MTCAVCSATNPQGAAFCMKCGSKLEATCGNCSNPLPDGAVFCPACGHDNSGPAAATTTEDRLRRYIPEALLKKLEAAQRSGGGIQGERRTVTMLFCDVQGSSSAAEHLDPEDWADIMNGAFQHLITPVYTYEGTLARLMGDAILAFFGAPIGHEDDPERAIRAGLEIIEAIKPYVAEVQASHGVEFSVRVGINTGLVVVGAVGSDLRVEYTAMGDAVNVAARMEQTAVPGTVQVSDTTKSLVDRLFDFTDLGPIEVKGRSAAVRSWRVDGARERPVTTRGIEGLQAPLIGRDDELAALRGALDTVRAGGGAVVSLMGEAGLGKSRLMAEFRTEAGDIPWHEGRSLSYETSSAYAPVRGIVRSMVGIGSEASPTEIWPAVRDATADHAPARGADLAPFLTSMLGGAVPDEHAHRLAYLDPSAHQEGIFSAVVEFVSAAAAKEPLVVVFEDLHWADSASLTVATRLLAAAEHARVLLILVYRPRRDEGSWTVREHAERDHPHLHISIELAALPDDDARRLISELLAIDGLPEHVRALVLERSDGNPYFLEEVVRSMIDAGVVGRVDDRWVAIGDVSTVAIPDTLAALITTRLDALDEASRVAAQAGSVLGREFRYEELAALTSDIADLDRAMVDLQRRDLVREVSRAPRRVYRFKHALVQETAYAGMLRKQRLQLHAVAADTLSRSQPDRVEDIADHYLAARRDDEAIPFLVAAGERALKAFLLPEAHRRFDLALELLDDEGDAGLLRRALEGSSKAFEAVFDIENAVAGYQRLIDTGIRLDDPGMRISGTNKLAFLKGIFLGQREDALADLAGAEQLATDETDGEGLVEACIAQCYLRTGNAEFEEVEHYMKKVAQLGQDLGLTEPTLFGMAHFANALTYMTRFDEALEQAEKTLAKAEEHGQLKYQAEMLSFTIPTCHLRNGDIESAMVALERGMAIALQIGDRVSEALAAITQGRIAMNQGAFDEALASYRRATDAGAATGIPYMVAVGMCTTGSCYRRIGGPYLEKALGLHAETIAMMEQPTGTTYGAWMWTEVGHCSLHAGHLDEAESLFRKAIDVHTAPMWLMRPSALAGLIELALRADDTDEAERLFEEMKAYVQERKMADFTIDIEVLGARLAARRGDFDAALRSLTRTEAITRNAGLLRLLFDVHVLQRDVHDQRGDEPARAEASAAARNVGLRIAEGIRGEEIRRAFEEEVEAALAR